MKYTLEQRAKRLLGIWSDQVPESRMYRYAGIYWEVLYPILKKYAERELRIYEGLLLEEFDCFLPQLFKALTTGDEEKDWENAVNYLNHRIHYYSQNDVDSYEFDDGIIFYFPNRCMPKPVFD